MSPWIAGKLVYPLQEWALGRPTFAYLRQLEQTQWLDRAALAAFQCTRLNRLLGLALQHSPWHAARIRAAGLEGPVRAGALDRHALCHLPTMSKDDARRHVEALVWRAVPGGAFKYNTGGSSGEPLIFYFGRERQASDAAGRMRARRWWRVQPGEREAYLWGAPVELDRRDRTRTWRDWLINQRVLNAFAMSPTRMDDYLAQLRIWQPRCLYGYASSLALLAAHAEARGTAARLPGLRVVCTTGETLYPHQRALIERVFGAPVASEFGSRDIGFTAHETPAGDMLLMSESHMIEVLDAHGQPVPPGTAGEAVITGLTSAAQPFIRYRTGDVVRLSASAAACGRGLDVLAEVCGRQTDFVVDEHGTVMHALAVIYVLRATEGVAEFKCIQHTSREMEVRIVPTGQWTARSHANVVGGLKARLGDGLQVRLELTDAIAPEASGKHRYVVSEVPLAHELRQALAP